MIAMGASDVVLGEVLSAFTWRWVDQPTEYWDSYVGRSIGGPPHGTIMPPSPGVSEYKISGQYTGDSIQYTLAPVWRPGVLDRLKKLPREQLEHRSRSCAIAGKSLVVNEMKHRVRKLGNNRKWLDLITSLTTESQKQEISLAIVDKTIDALAFDFNHIQHYIKEHETRSTGTGYRWGELGGLGPSQWKQIYERECQFFEELRANVGRYLDGAYFTGMRARSEPLTYDEIFAAEHQKEVKRTRMVMFRPCLSMVGAFMPDKPSWYKSMLSESNKIIHREYETVYPMVEGGQAYKIASDWLQAGYRQVAFDGGSWESVVGSALGKWIGWATTRFGGYDSEASGMYNTGGGNTIITDICDLFIIPEAKKRGLFTGEPKIINFSDDKNLYVKTKDPLAWGAINMGELEELQVMDTKLEFMLGVGYWRDRAAPRVIGAKITTDRADKSIPVDFSGAGYFEEPIRGKSDERETEMWLGLYEGRFGSGTLLSCLEDVSAVDFRGGSELIHQAVRDGFSQMSLAELKA